MKGQQGKRSGRIDPWRLADEANLRFVELARLLMRLVTLSPQARAGLSIDSRALASLAEKVDRLFRRCDTARAPDPHERADARDGSVADESLGPRLKELFHHDALHRLAAARWIRQHRCAGAIPPLEGVLSIEENREVRGEIERALQVLKAPRPGTKEMSDDQSHRRGSRWRFSRRTAVRDNQTRKT